MDLYRQKVIKTYNKLILTALPERDPRLHEIRLDKIFVKLRIAVEESFRATRYLEPDFDKNDLEFDKKDDLEKVKYLRQREKKVEAKPMTTAEALQKHRYLIITGSPGSGKTTLLRWLAVTFADQRQSENLGKAFTEETVPILLELRRFSERFHRLAKNHPATFDLAEEISAFVGDEPRFHGVSSDWMRQTLAQQPCLLLLDGLDEIADQMTRQRLLEAVEAFVQNPTYAKVSCLLTTRPHGFQNVSLGAKFQKTEIQAFTPNDIAEFIRHWYATAYVEEYQAEASELITAIKAQKRVTELAENPLLCTIIAIIYRKNRKLPIRRVKLYLECCEILLDTWEQNKTEIAALSPLIAGVDWETKLKLLMPIAYRFHEQEQKLALPEGEVVKLLAAALDELNLMQGSEAEQEARRFVAAIRDRSGILQGRGDGTLEFSHRTFQEYLAARYIAKQTDPVYIDLVMKHLHKDWWREVHLLVIGHLGSSDTAEKAEKLMSTILRVYKKPNLLLLPYKWFNFVNLGKLLPRLQWQRRIAWHTMREFELVAQGYADCTAPAKTKPLSQILSEFVLKRVLKWQYNPFYEPQQKFLITTAAKQNLPRYKLVTVFLQGLSAKNILVRSAAAQSLGQLGQVSDEVITALLKASFDKAEWEWQHAAAQSLGQLGQASDEVITALLKALQDKEILVRHAAAQSLGQLGQASDEVITALLKALQDKEILVRHVAAKSLGQLGQASDEVIAALLKALQDKEKWVQRDAADSLGQLAQVSDKVIDVLVKVLLDKDKDKWVRYAAAKSLGQSGQASDEVIDALLKALLDEDLFMRYVAAKSLGQLGTSDKAIDALFKALQDKDEYVRYVAAESLGQLGQASDEVIDALLKALQDKYGYVRRAVAESLGQLGQASDEVIDALLKALLDKDEDVRNAAADSLGQLGQASDKVIAALLKLLDKDEPVQFVAANSLAQLGQASDKVINALVKVLLDKDEYVTRSAAAYSFLDKLKIEDEKIVKQVLIRLNRDLHDSSESVRREIFESLRKHLNGRQIPGYRWKPLQNHRKKQKLRLISLSSILILLILLVLIFKTPIIPNTIGIILTLIVGGIQMAIWFKDWFKGDKV
jgi:HEAT repeat protein/energy-coupling factor transporter ATP-binding protein EcfA2